MYSNELDSQSDVGALNVRGVLNFAMEEPPVGAAFPSTWITRDVPLHLYNEGLGECEAEGGLGGQDNLLVPGVGRSRGSRTRT